MIKKLNKIVCIIISILLIMLSPIGSYVQGENAKVYALESSLESAIAKYVIPVTAYMLCQYDNSMKTLENVAVTVSQINTTITNLNKFQSEMISTIPLATKAIIAHIYTSLTSDDINSVLGTSYTESSLDNLSASLLQAKNDGLLGSEYSQIYNLGISHTFAQALKLYNSNALYDNSSSIDYLADDNSILFYYKDFAVATYPIKIMQEYFNYLFWNLFGKVIVNSQITYSTYSSNFQVINNSTYQFGDSRIRLKIYSKNLAKTEDHNYYMSTNGLLTESTSYADQIYLEKLNINGSWDILKNYHEDTGYKLGDIKLNTFLNDINTYLNVNLTGSIFYTESKIPTIFNLCYEGTNIINEAGTWDSSISVPAVGSSYFDGEDTTLSDAERLINSVSPTDTYDLDITAEILTNTDADTNLTNPVISEVIVSDPAGVVPDVDTANPDNSIPDGDTEIGDPEDTSGILAWLRGLWEILKSLWQSLLAFLASIITLLTSIFTNTSSMSEATEGIDWGSFTGLFDIFYIFYYLIIIVIMILLKFLAVVFSMLSIPSNSSLFANYPTMLAGLNYIKSIKVGGFNITLQQIFEYMFTVFFFLFIVTTLQKLYHNFAGIERQTLNQEQKWESNSNVIYRDGNYINKKTGEIQDYKYK